MPDKLMYDESDHLYLTKITGQIYISSLNLLDNSILENEQIYGILNLTDDVYHVKRNHLICLNQPISSKSFFNLMKVIPKCLIFLDEALNLGKKVAICCHDGYSRALIVLFAYYCLKYGIDTNSSYYILRRSLKFKLPKKTTLINAQYEKHLNNMCRLVKSNHNYTRVTTGM